MAYLGERSAVDSNSGQSVHQSDPGLRRPTPPVRDGRKPSARPRSSDSLESREAGLSQRKTGRGAGRSLAIEIEREVLDTSSTSAKRDAVDLDDEAISQILDVFRLLDRWDREGSHATTTM
jgi:hypothetical protein